MGAKRLKPEQFPDEVFLGEAIRDGRATLQTLSMKAIGEPDFSLQCRVEKWNMEHVHHLSQLYKISDSIHPIVVFEDPETHVYRIADGFNRWKMHQTDRLESIRAFVIEGTYRDAMNYSTMSNQRTLLARTNNDIKKAVFALLDDPEWFTRASQFIGDHVGIKGQTVQKYRIEFCEAKNLKVPSMVLDSRGIPRAVYRKKEATLRRAGFGYAVRRNGDDIYLGVNLEAAKTLDDKHAREQRRRVALLSHWGALSQFFFARGFAFKSCADSMAQYPSCGGGAVGYGVIVVPLVFDTATSLHVAVFKALATRAKLGEDLRPIILCYAESGPTALIDISRQLGVEFMTPEDLVASLQSERKPTE